MARVWYVSQLNQNSLLLVFLKQVLVQMLLIFDLIIYFFAHEIMKNNTLKSCSKLANFFQYCQQAQTQPKSQFQFLFHKICLLCDLCIVTLVIITHPPALNSLRRYNQSRHFERRTCTKLDQKILRAFPELQRYKLIYIPL